MIISSATQIDRKYSLQWADFHFRSRLSPIKKSENLGTRLVDNLRRKMRSMKMIQDIKDVFIPFKTPAGITHKKAIVPMSLKYYLR